MEPSPFGDVSSRLTTEQILYNIKQEYKRMQKRRHLEASFQQTDPDCSSDPQPRASPGTSSATSSPLKKEQPLFTLRQVGMICERLLKEREEKVREEYEEILNTKLAERYDGFVKFNARSNDVTMENSLLALFHKVCFLRLWAALSLVELLQEVPTMTCSNASTHL